MHRPDAGIVGRKFNVPCLAGSYQNGIFIDLCLLHYRKAIGGHDLELMPVQVDGVVVHLDIAEPDAHRVSIIDLQRKGLWVTGAVDGKKVEGRVHEAEWVEPGGQFAPLQLMDSPFLQDTEIVFVILTVLGLGVFHNQSAEKACVILRHDIHVRVIQVSPWRIRYLEAIVHMTIRLNKGGRLNGRHPVHIVGDIQPVPVHACFHRQMIDDTDDNFIAGEDVDRRPGSRTVVSPCSYSDSIYQFPVKFLRDKGKELFSVVKRILAIFNSGCNYHIIPALILLNISYAAMAAGILDILFVYFTGLLGQNPPQMDRLYDLDFCSER